MVLSTMVSKHNYCIVSELNRFQCLHLQTLPQADMFGALISAISEPSVCGDLLVRLSSIGLLLAKGSKMS